MADTKISALTNLTSLADADELPIADASDLGVTKSITLATLRSQLQSAGAMLYIKRLATSQANATTTMAELTGLTSTVAAGRWRFDYWLMPRSNQTTNSFKFAVNHSGTTTYFLYWMSVPCDSAAAAVGSWSNNLNATTGFMLSSFATRVKNTTLGPGTGVDQIAGNLLVRIGGTFMSTTSGDVKLMFASQTVGTTTLDDVTTLLLRRLA